MLVELSDDMQGGISIRSYVRDEGHDVTRKAVIGCDVIRDIRTHAWAYLIFGIMMYWVMSFIILARVSESCIFILLSFVF